MGRVLFFLGMASVINFSLPIFGQAIPYQSSPRQQRVFPPNQAWGVQPRQTIPKTPVPHGGTTRVLPDGRVVTITPFTAEQKRQIRQREAQRKRIKKIREREIAQQAPNTILYPRLAGEFEKQKAILLSVSDWQPYHYPVLSQLVEKTRGHANLLILFNDRNQYDGKPQLPGLIKQLAKQTNNDFSHVRFLKFNLNTVWLRDFGPLVAETESGGSMAMNFFYDTVRPLDDDFPEAWSKLTNTTHNHVPWTLQGGNLSANGYGLAITTTRLFEDNRLYRPGKTFQEDEQYVRRRVMKYCNIKELLVLKPLENEATRHVDMFATFLAPNLVLVAQVDPRYDPQNARILDWNAQYLSQVKLDHRPLRVERIWIPPRQGEHWTPYTNIILTDKLVLLPTYQSDPPKYVKAAVQTYRKLLPKHQVKTIDMTSMKKLGGSLHCLSCSLPAFADLPQGLLTFEEASKDSGM